MALTPHLDVLTRALIDHADTSARAEAMHGDAATQAADDLAASRAAVAGKMGQDQTEEVSP